MAGVMKNWGKEVWVGTERSGDQWVRVEGEDVGVGQSAGNGRAGQVRRK